MAADDPTKPEDANGTDDIEPADVRAELDRQRTRTRGEEFEGGLLAVLSRALDTDTRTRIYVHLRRRPRSTVEEVAEGTGLYPGAIRRVLPDLHDEGVVERRNRTDGTEDDDEYTAVPPTELLDVAFDRLRDEFDPLGRDRSRRGTTRDGRSEPVTIPVEEPTDGESDNGDV